LVDEALHADCEVPVSILLEGAAEEHRTGSRGDRRRGRGVGYRVVEERSDGTHLFASFFVLITKPPESDDLKLNCLKVDVQL